MISEPLSHPIDLVGKGNAGEDGLGLCLAQCSVQKPLLQISGGSKRMQRMTAARPSLDLDLGFGSVILLGKVGLPWA